MNQIAGVARDAAVRLVFDTNVIVSALLLIESKPRKAFDRALQTGRILLSDETLTELYQVLSRRRLRRYIDPHDIRDFLAALVREAEWIDVKTRLSVCRDPKDNKFLDLAVSGSANYLVTGDSDLLVLNPFRGVTILSPGSFLEIPISDSP